MKTSDLEAINKWFKDRPSAAQALIKAYKHYGAQGCFAANALDVQEPAVFDRNMHLMESQIEGLLRTESSLTPQQRHNIQKLANMMVQMEPQNAIIPEDAAVDGLNVRNLLTGSKDMGHRIQSALQKARDTATIEGR